MAGMYRSFLFWLIVACVIEVTHELVAQTRKFKKNKPNSKARSAAIDHPAGIAEYLSENFSLRTDISAAEVKELLGKQKGKAAH